MWHITFALISASSRPTRLTFYVIAALALVTTLRRVLEGTTTTRRSSRTAEHIRYPFGGLSQNGEWRATVSAHGANFRAVPSGSDTDMTLERAPRCLQASHLKPCVRECGDVTLTRLVISGSQSSYGGLQKTVQSGRKFKKHLILLLNYSVWVWNLVPSWLSLEDRRKSSSSLMLWPSLQKKIKHFSVSYFKYYFFLLLYSFIYLYFV